MVWAIFEIDPDTNEANGQVHPFCSYGCLEAGLEEAIEDVSSRGFSYKVDKDSITNYNAGSVCEECRYQLLVLCAEELDNVDRS